MHVLLNMHEGLAQYCEQQVAKGAAASTAVDRYRNFYQKRVGIDYRDRDDVRRQVNEILNAEGRS
jgi:hypothetical protein